MFALVQPNPFSPNYANTQDKNFLILRNPILRSKAGISYLDNSLLMSSQYFPSARQAPYTVKGVETQIAKAL